MRSIFKRSILFLLLSETVFAQWNVKSKHIYDEGQDGHISLVVELPVLIGDSNSTARKTINHALGQISGVDGLIRDARRRIVNHKRVMASKKHNSSNGDDDDGNTADDAYEHSLDYEVGVNDGKLFNICFFGYWHGGVGVAGNPYWKASTFDALTGAQLQLKDLFIPGWEAKLKNLAKLTLKAENDDSEFLFSDWEQRLKDAKFEIYFTPNQVILGFEKYSIADGATGVVTVEIPLNKIRSIIQPSSKLSYLLK